MVFPLILLRLTAKNAVTEKKLNTWTKLERVKGIEPSLSAWEAGVMPLYDTRFQG